MTRLSRDDILKADDLPHEDVNVPEWKTGADVPVVRIRTLTAGERDRFEAVSLVERKKLEDVRALLICLSAVDEAGARLFTEEDIPALSKKSSLAMNRLFGVASRLSGLTNADVKELVKN